MEQKVSNYSKFLFVCRSGDGTQSLVLARLYSLIFSSPIPPNFLAQRGTVV